MDTEPIMVDGMVRDKTSTGKVRVGSTFFIIYGWIEMRFWLRTLVLLAVAGAEYAYGEHFILALKVSYLCTD